ncbi:hypothetical protein P7K49_002398 [Saguinus oedipus]|uniref:Golgin subfamily A conserved domain-containing protein n=1 Tax=Saguinus oedipus TaxID=9490 RepID=A0ABQ9WL61_SAGOE|nr:hypothetical protein P7K49_002398 [Saguinus oedipus]
MEVKLKSQEAQCLQQHVATSQQLSPEKEALHRRLLLQAQLEAQLQQQDAKRWPNGEHLEAANQWNQQLQAPVSLTAFPGEGTGDRTEEEERAQDEEGTVSRIELRSWK